MTAATIKATILAILLSGCNTGEPESPTSGAGFVRSSSINVINDEDGSVYKALTAIREEWLVAVERHIRIIRVVDRIDTPLLKGADGAYIGDGVMLLRGPRPQYQITNSIIHEAGHSASSSFNPVYGQDARNAVAGKVRWADTDEEIFAQNCELLYRGKAAGHCWISPSS